MTLRGIYIYNNKGEKVMERGPIYTIEELLEEHLVEAKDTIACYRCFEHEDWEERGEEGELLSFVSYFYLDFKYDMIITASRSNVFSKKQWSVLRDTLLHRTKSIRIQSDPKNIALHKGAARYGGYFIDGEILFPYPWDKEI